MKPGRSLWISVLAGWYDHAIEELDRLIRSCADELWLQNVWEVKPTDRIVLLNPKLGEESDQQRIQFRGSCWFVAYHTVLALDDYLSPTAMSEPPKNFEWLHGNEAWSHKPVTKDEVLEYLAACRTKAHDTFASLTDEAAARTRTDEPFASALVRGLMHLREHTGQLALFIGLEATG